LEVQFGLIDVQFGLIDVTFALALAARISISTSDIPRAGFAYNRLNRLKPTVARFKGASKKL